VTQVSIRFLVIGIERVFVDAGSARALQFQPLVGIGCVRDRCSGSLERGRRRGWRLLGEQDGRSE
jgi:hypothetical protein